MTEPNDKISSFLNAETGVDRVEDAATAVVAFVEDKRKTVDEKIEGDFDQVRANLTAALNHCVSLFPEMVAFTRAAESPKMYEAASDFMRMFGELNKQLAETSLKMDRTEQPKKGKTKNEVVVSPPDTPPVNHTSIENVTFVSNEPTEVLLQRLLKVQKDGDVIDV